MLILSRLFFVLCCLLVVGAIESAEAAQPAQSTNYRILLRSRQFTPQTGIEPAARARLQSGGTRAGARHVLLQLHATPGRAEKEALAARGVRLLNYLPNYAWFASVSATAEQLDSIHEIRWLGEIQPADKLSDSLRAGKPSARVLGPDGTVSLRLSYFNDVTEAEAIDAVTRHGGVVEFGEPLLRVLAIRLPGTQVFALAGEDVVRWLAETPPPPTPMNDSIRSRIRVNDVQATPYNLNGAGVSLGIWDCGPVSPHVDFTGRLTNLFGQNDNCNPSLQHSTHVAGIMTGTGANSVAQGGTANQWRGMAPGATLVAYDFYSSTPEVQSAISTFNLDIANNSWGFVPSTNPPEPCEPVFGNYNNLAPEYDQIITGLYGKRISATFAAGNYQNDIRWSPTCANFFTITPPGTAKNVITVGATNSLDDSMTAFSSWGPTDDGRLKPDVVAPGYRNDFPGETGCLGDSFFTGIKSTCPDGGYGTLYGTSMATPAVSGMLALVLQQYRLSLGQPTAMPLPSTLKALTVHGAVDLGNAGPDYKFGWGRVDAKNSVDLVKRTKHQEGTVSHGAAVTYTANVLNCDTTLKATLAWDDPAAQEGALVALVNDLDLTVTDPLGGTYAPWVLDPASPNTPASRGTDDHNNVEQVLVSAPMPGKWTVSVRGFNVPQGPQGFSVVSEAFNTPSLSAIIPAAAKPGDQIVLRGKQFEQGCSSNSLIVNFGGGVTTTVAPGNWTNETITVTVPANAQSGNVSVTTPAGTSNALYFGLLRPKAYLPSLMRDYPPPFNWIDASDGTRIVNGDDMTQTITLPFAFRFYGNTYNSITVSSNGFVSFDPAVGPHPYIACIPTMGAPNNAIYGFWADLDPSAGGAVWYKVVSNSVVIEWQNVPRYGVLDAETFEIILNASAGYVIVQYLSVQNTNDTVVGIENANGTAAVQSYCHSSGVGEVGTPPAAGKLFFYQMY